MYYFYRDVVNSYGNDAYRMSDSPWAEDIKKIVEIDETAIAELEFTDILKTIEDKELREKLDAAAGKLTTAYEKYGYIIGYLTKAWDGMLDSDANPKRIKLPIPRERR